MGELWSTKGIFAHGENRVIPTRVKRRMTIPSRRTMWEAAAVIEMSARVGFHLLELEEPIFDSLFVFDRLDVSESGSRDEQGVHIVIGFDENWLTEVLSDKAMPILQVRSECSSDRGIVYVYRDMGKTIMVVTGTKPEMTLLAARYLVTDGFGKEIDFDHPVIFISPERAPLVNQQPGEQADLASGLSLHNIFTTDGIYHVQAGELHPTLDVTFLVDDTYEIEEGGVGSEETIAAVELMARMALSAGNMTFPVTCCAGEQPGTTTLVVSTHRHGDESDERLVELTDDKTTPHLQITASTGELVPLVREIIREWFEPTDVLERDTWRHRFAMLGSPSRDIASRAQLAMMACHAMDQEQIKEIRIPAHLARPMELWNGVGAETVSIDHAEPAWTVDWDDAGEIADMEDFIVDFFATREGQADAPMASDIEVTTTISQISFTTWAAVMQKKLEAAYRVQARFVYRNANKSGLHWFMNEVLPHLKGIEGIHRVDVAARAFRPETQYIDRPYRFLQELYPVDELLSAELGILLEQVELRLLESESAPMFQVRALDAEGEQLGTWTWEGWTEGATYMPEKPELGQVLVPAAGCRIYERDGNKPVASRVFRTNPFRFWRWYQTILSQIEQRSDLHVDTPKFMQLECHVTMDAEDEKIPYQEEVNSVLEALHEDIYFYTLHAFYEYGCSVGDLTWNAPGGILPFMHTESGVSPRATVSLYPFPKTDELTMVSEKGTHVIHPMNSATFQCGRVTRLKWNASGCRFAFRGMAGETLSEVCGKWLSMGAAFGCDHVIEGMSYLRYGEKSIDNEMLVNRDVTMWMNQHQARIPGRAMRLDYSFQGEWIWFVELFGRGYPGRISSPVKHSLYKPTLFITARHHANEVSSTNAALRLIDEMVTEDKLLEAVNLVIVPLENADGANLHARMAAEHPKWKLHAARYNACGLEFQEYRFQSDTVFGESRVYSKIWERWKPDIAIDDHGIPSHEWIQPFSGYSSPPRFPVSYWIPSARMYTIWRQPTQNRAAYTEAYESLRRHVTDRLDRNPDVARDNAMWLRTYSRWGNKFDADYFPIELSNGSIAHTWGSQPNPASRNLIERFPDWVTADVITEVNDETVQDVQLQACAEAHLVVNRATLEWISQTKQKIIISPERLASGKVRIRIGRLRPVI
ncbi:M14 family metallopeptidase [Alicyclobacillus dauci]|uniref:M14 family metallopeptidase n=1 Tax=Alicyclobacillus dauci TaxID=1475485 RepID=A0ABY6Z1N8_9BACL|nr:M14 family metallopeptidase [Alicyclobacillus dauci]WAH36423.1 M14 family metallopeptidase [Alicyclobacillus dauci]